MTAAESHPSPKRTVVSLGMSCQAAHQLTRMAATSEGAVSFIKGPFDWLICEPTAAAAWLRAGLCPFDAGQIVERQGHAWWPEFGFWFWHGFFQKNVSGKPLDIPGTLDRELSKLAHQAQVFDTLSPQNTLFVWANSQNNLVGDVYSKDDPAPHLTGPKRQALQSALDGFFGMPTSILFVSRSDRDDDGAADLHLPAETSEWKGQDADWDAMVRPHVFSFR